MDDVERRKVYREQVLRFEEYRKEALVFLISQGEVQSNPGLLASEGTICRDDVADFSAKQLKLAERLLAKR